MSVVRPYVPKENSINEAALCYLSCERAVLDEMRLRVSAWAHSQFGPDWHSIVRDDPNLWGMEGWNQPEDAFYILKCLAQIPVSKISHVFGHPKDIGPKAKPVFLARNRWSHFSNQLVMSTIRQEIAQLRDFAKIAELDVSEGVDQSLQELARVASTQIASPSVAKSTSSASDERTSVPERPRIGEPWPHELPKEVWEISEKLRDVKAKVDGQSMKLRWDDEEQGRFAVARLLRMNLSPRVLYVDSADGATVGFREGHPYLVGYAGHAPDVAPSRYQGFFDDRSFEYVEGDLLLSDSGEPAFSGWAGRRNLLATLASHNVSDDDEVLVTDFGHVVVMSENGARRVAAIDEQALIEFWDAG